MILTGIFEGNFARIPATSSLRLPKEYNTRLEFSDIDHSVLVGWFLPPTPSKTLGIFSPPLPFGSPQEI